MSALAEVLMWLLLIVVQGGVLFELIGLRHTVAELGDCDCGGEHRRPAPE